MTLNGPRIERLALGVLFMFVGSVLAVVGWQAAHSKPTADQQFLQKVDVQQAQFREAMSNWCSSRGEIAYYTVIVRDQEHMSLQEAQEKLGLPGLVRYVYESPITDPMEAKKEIEKQCSSDDVK